MNENRIIGFKAMKLNLYMPTNAPKYNGGRRTIDFKFIDNATEQKRMRKNTRKHTNRRLNALYSKRSTLT
jgi:hypothetical protein